MDVAMFAVLLAGLMECSDIQGIVDKVRGDNGLSSEIKQELVETLIKITPECELNERSKNT